MSTSDLNRVVSLPFRSINIKDLTSSMSDLKDLLAQREQLEAQLEAAFKEERLGTLAEIVRKMKLHGITFDEVRGPVQPVARKLAPKYRDPATGAEWSGRGSPPNWIKNAPDRSTFLVQQSLFPDPKH